MKIAALAFVLTLAVLMAARAQVGPTLISVAGPVTGMDETTGAPIQIDSSQRAFVTYDVDSLSGLPVESTGVYYLDGTAYHTGYEFAEVYLQIARIDHL
jgi:hypothetical protein